MFMDIIKIVAVIALLYFPDYAAGRNNSSVEARTYSVYVVQSRWHTGLIFKTADIDPGFWPEVIRYRDRVYVDVGWGDEVFYQAASSPVHLAARAVLWPTQSVLQVYAFSNSIRAAYGSDARIMKIPVGEAELAALSRYIANSYMRDVNGFVQPSTKNGESSIFFLSTGKYHLFNTCNTWVGKAFKDAGLPVRTFFLLNANQLFRRLSRIPGAEFEK
jgi:uncharacterized protein (TIGR02117 family)